MSCRWGPWEQAAGVGGRMKAKCSADRTSAPKASHMTDVQTRANTFSPPPSWPLSFFSEQTAWESQHIFTSQGRRALTVDAKCCQHFKLRKIKRDQRVFIWCGGPYLSLRPLLGHVTQKRHGFSPGNILHLLWLMTWNYQDSGHSHARGRASMPSHLRRFT